MRNGMDSAAAQEELRLTDRDRRIRQAERELADTLKRLELILSYEEVVSTQGGTFKRFVFYDARPAPARIDSAELPA